MQYWHIKKLIYHNVYNARKEYFPDILLPTVLRRVGDTRELIFPTTTLPLPRQRIQSSPMSIELQTQREVIIDSFSFQLYTEKSFFTFSVHIVWFITFVFYLNNNLTRVYEIIFLNKSFIFNVLSLQSYWKKTTIWNLWRSNMLFGYTI